MPEAYIILCKSVLQSRYFLPYNCSHHLFICRISSCGAYIFLFPTHRHIINNLHKKQGDLTKCLLIEGGNKSSHRMLLWLGPKATAQLYNYSPILTSVVIWLSKPIFKCPITKFWANKDKYPVPDPYLLAKAEKSFNVCLLLWKTLNVNALFRQPIDFNRKYSM